MPILSAVFGRPLWAALFLVLPLLRPAPAQAQTAPADVVPWGTKPGIERLERSAHKLAFFALANQYGSQENRAFCGPATAAIVLNAMRLGNDAAAKPVDRSRLVAGDSDYLPKGMDPLLSKYTQNTFFTPATDKVKTRAEVLGKPRGGRRDGGIQLRQLAAMFAQHGVEAQVRVVADGDADGQVKAELIKALSEPGTYAVVNYYRPALGQKGGGHISPLAAYDDESDSFLILDVNPNTAPWVWARSAALIAAMRTKDTGENRGYLLLRDK